MMKTAEFKMPDIDPKLLPMLLAGGAGALTGGALTAMSPERQGESRSKRRWRVLRNALLLGGAGAGGTALLQKGWKDAVSEPLPAADTNPTRKAIHDISGGPIGLGAGAVGGGLLNARLVGQEEREAGNSLLKDVKGIEVPKPKVALREELAKLHKNMPGTSMDDKIKWLSPVRKQHIRDAGINIMDEVNKIHPKTIGRLPAWKEEAKILGQRVIGGGGNRTRFGRGARMGAAMGLPLLISYLSKSTPQR